MGSIVGCTPCVTRAEEDESELKGKETKELRPSETKHAGKHKAEYRTIESALMRHVKTSKTVQL